jgi:hypothetical protein
MRLYWLLIVIGLTGCRYDVDNLEPCSEETACLDIPNSTSWLGYDEDYIGSYFPRLCLNPNNSNQFVYVEIPVGEAWGTGSLKWYDVTTGVSQILQTNIGVVNDLQWSVNGRIYYTQSGDVRSLSTNDVIPQNETNDGMASWSAVNPSGTLLYYYQSVSNEIRLGIVQDVETGTHVDTIIECLPRCWTGNILIQGLATDITLFDPSTNTYQMFDVSPDGSDIEDCDAFNLSKIYFSTYRGGLSYLQPENGHIQVLKEPCDNIIYSAISALPDGLLVSRTFRKKISETRIDKYDEIWSIGLNGCDCQRILPPP